MSDSEHRGGPSVEGMWGCGIAALIGVPVFCFLTLIDALGDCEPETDCHRGFLRYVAFPVAIITLTVFFGVGTLVRRVWGNGR